MFLSADILTIGLYTLKFDMIPEFMYTAPVTEPYGRVVFFELLYDIDQRGSRQLFFSYMPRGWVSYPATDRLRELRPRHRHVPYEQPFIDELYQHLGIPCPNLT